MSVTQGDDPDPDFVTEVGQGIVKHAEEWPDDTPHRIVYHYDIDQTVTVEIYRLPDKITRVSFEIDRIANMSEDKIEEAAQKIEEIFPGTRWPPQECRRRIRMPPRLRRRSRPRPC